MGVGGLLGDAPATDRVPSVAEMTDSQRAAEWDAQAKPQDSQFTAIDMLPMPLPAPGPALSGGGGKLQLPPPPEDSTFSRVQSLMRGRRKGRVTEQARPPPGAAPLTPRDGDGGQEATVAGASGRSDRQSSDASFFAKLSLGGTGTGDV